jgi:hypothetical protein
MSAALPWPASEGPDSDEDIPPTPVQAATLLRLHTPLHNPAALTRLVQGVGAILAPHEDSGRGSVQEKERGEERRGMQRGVCWKSER